MLLFTLKKKTPSAGFFQVVSQEEADLIDYSYRGSSACWQNVLVFHTLWLSTINNTSTLFSSSPPPFSSLLVYHWPLPLCLLLSLPFFCDSWMPSDGRLLMGTSSGKNWLVYFKVNADCNCAGPYLALLLDKLRKSKALLLQSSSDFKVACFCWFVLSAVSVVFNTTLLCLTLLDTWEMF